MTQLLEAVAVWRALIWALLIWGPAPFLVLWLVVKVYPSDCPRRQELMAELCFVKRAERPFWVLEQIPLALFSGVPERRMRTQFRKLAQAAERFTAAATHMNDAIHGLSLAFATLGSSDRETVDYFREVKKSVRVGYSCYQVLERRLRRCPLGDDDRATAAKALSDLEPILDELQRNMRVDLRKWTL